MDGITALRNVLSRMWSERQDGILSYCGDGKWVFVSTGLPQTTPEELNALFDMAGITPKKIEVRGSCDTCLHSINGRERGYDMPCVKCLRPSHDLWEPTP